MQISPRALQSAARNALLARAEGEGSSVGDTAQRSLDATVKDTARALGVDAQTFGPQIREAILTAAVEVNEGRGQGLGAFTGEPTSAGESSAGAPAPHGLFNALMMQVAAKGDQLANGGADAGQVDPADALRKAMLDEGQTLESMKAALENLSSSGVDPSTLPGGHKAAVMTHLRAVIDASTPSPEAWGAALGLAQTLDVAGGLQKAAKRAVRRMRDTGGKVDIKQLRALADAAGLDIDVTPTRGPQKAQKARVDKHGRRDKPRIPGQEWSQDLIPKQWSAYIRGPQRGFPLGLPSFEAFQQMGAAFQAGLQAKGVDDAVGIVQGSSVRGYRFGTDDDPVAFGPHSDYDIALVSEELILRADDLGLTKDLNETGLLSRMDMQALGILEVADALSALTGQETSFKVFANPESALRGKESESIRMPVG